MVEDKKNINENRKLTLNIVEDGKNQKRPHCKHGPTLLLTKKIGSLEKRFLACSAYRDNKCPILKKPVDTEKFALDRRKIRKNLVRILKAPKEGRGYCLTCAELFLDSDYHKHVRHDILTKISMKHIRRPTMLLKASTQKEKEAQYFFSPKTIDYIVESLKQLDFDRLILIGCPSIHEKIQCNKKTLGMESVLLDIDQRYRQFYPRKQFVLFNMFNNFFFEGDDGQKKLDDFLESSPPGRLCILIDPPFGGLIQAIGQTLDKLHKRWLKMHRAHWNRAFVRRKINSNGYEMGVMIFLPYFSEPKVLSFIKGMKMTDYKVYYTNHSSYKRCTCKNKIGSAVRMFTNITPKLLKLPLDEGYKYCKPCQRYVSPENSHCAKCNACTSKDGRPSRHCDKCKKCFKDTWSHCDSCGVCGLPVNHQHS